MTCALIVSQGARSQNLLANPSFEEVNICTEYFAPCAPVGWENVSPAFKMRYGYHGYKNNAGKQHIWLLAGATSDDRNYAQTRLLCPMVKGKQYRLTGIIGINSTHTSILPELDFYFSKEYVFRETGRALTDLPPALSARKENVVKDGEKTFFRLEAVFTAAGDYTHLLMGQLQPRPSRIDDGPEYVFIDFLELQPVEKSPLCREASAMADSLAHRRHRHTLPGQFHLAQHPGTPLVPLVKPGCVDIEVPGPEVFTVTGRSRYPKSASRIDSMILRYEPGGGRKVLITGVWFNPYTGQFDKSKSAGQAAAIRNVLIKDFGFSAADIRLAVLDSALPRFEAATTAGRLRNNYVGIEFCVADPSATPAPPTTLKTVAIPIPPDTLIIPDVLFKFDRHELNPALFSTLDSLVNKIPRAEGTTLQLTGHTDNAGADAYNQTLSQRRAESLAAYLRGKGLGDFILTVSGEGEKRPAFPNDSAEGRRRNRRVEIIIYRQ